MYVLKSIKKGATSSRQRKDERSRKHGQFVGNFQIVSITLFLGQYVPKNL